MNHTKDKKAEKTRRCYIIAAALTVLLGACASGPEVIYDPLAGPKKVPFPNDQFFMDSTSPTGYSADGTLNVPEIASFPLAGQLNYLDGFSTVAEAQMDIDGLRIDLDTANDPGSEPDDRGIVVINVSAGSLLDPGVHYRVTRSAVVPFRTRLYIQWLKPLAPQTQYAVLATENLETDEGAEVETNELFELVRDTDPIDAGDLPSLSPAQIDKLQKLQAMLQPALQFAEADAPAGLEIDRDEVVLGWTFTTQSIGASLKALDAAAGPQILQISDTGMSTGDLGLGLPDTSDIYAGTMTLPYYLETPSGPHDPKPVRESWDATGTPAPGNGSLPGSPPCSSLAASEKTTACYPMPVQKSVQTVPVIAAVPNSSSTCPAPPAGGYPVTIFIHGFTRSRADALLLAPVLSNVCQLVIAIDLPLHGISSSSTFSAFRNTSVGERTFEVDYAETLVPDPGNDICVQVPADHEDIDDDGIPDCPGQHFLNLKSLITGKDNLRQGVIDNIHLLKTVQNADLTVVNNVGTVVGTIPVDTNTTNIVGISLGGVVASTLMGVNNEGAAASIAVGGGGVARLVDGSDILGPMSKGGLMLDGITVGTDKYENYLRFAQTLLDSADPINHAAEAAANYQIHFMEIAGERGVSLPDQVMPNDVARKPPNVIHSGPLSGTDPLVKEMGLNVVRDVNPETGTPACTAGPDTVVRFSRGDHSSLQLASGSPETTAEMQAEMTGFLGSGGTAVKVNGGGGACP